MTPGSLSHFLSENRGNTLFLLLFWWLGWCCAFSIYTSIQRTPVTHSVAQSKDGDEVGMELFISWGCIYLIGKNDMILQCILKKTSLYDDFLKKFLIFAALHSRWDLSSLARDQTCTLCIGSTES